MIETIHEVLNNNSDVQLLHFNRMVCSNLSPQFMNRLRIEGKDYLAENENLEISALIEKTLGAKANVVVENLRNIDNIHTSLSCEHILRTVGWSPLVSLEDGIRNTVDYVSSQLRT